MRAARKYPNLDYFQRARADARSWTMQTPRNVDKAPTKPMSTANACIYKALVNPQGRKKGRGKDDESRILENKFIQKVGQITNT